MDEQPPIPERALVIAAHPDDAEFGCGGTVAGWTAAGCQVTYILCTNGDKGTRDTEMTSPQLAELREREQRAAADTLGVAEIVWLGYPDGDLIDVPNTVLREQIVRVIRRVKPDVVFTHDPQRPYQLHSDHRQAGRVAIDAVFPAARDRLYHPQHEAEGLEPHKVGTMYLWGTDVPDAWFDISETLDRKVAALRRHVSQIADPEGLAERMAGWARNIGEPRGLSYAEAFKQLKFSR